jgi:hypothetical protein
MMSVSIRSNEVEEDIAIAARVSAPVLITAPGHCADNILHDIVARRHTGGSPTILTCEPGGSDTFAERLAGGLATDHEVVVWLKEVHRLSAAEQALVSALLADAQHRDDDASTRIIASSSVDLFERVEAGAFDAALFYRLNAIHIMLPLSEA